MLYLKKFNTQEDYDNTSPLSEFGVSLIADSNTVLYEANDTPLYIEALEDLSVSFSVNTVEYSMDGTTWEILEAGKTTPVIGKGRRIAFRAKDLTPTSSDGIGQFSISGLCNVGGNIMSMLFGEAYKEQYSLSDYQYAFYNFFWGCETIVNAKNLKLPATSLAAECYSHMFQGCTSLTSAPELPATSLAASCYYGMFQGCTSLISAPELPATSLAAKCYSHLFYGCTSLTSAPKLPAMYLQDYCYQYMFQGCTSLISAPELPATRLAASCYADMFLNCRAITSAPELPATSLAASCYSGMFNGCYALTSASALPAMTLEASCYSRMYEYCTSLSAAPTLPATTLALECYARMFCRCSSLTSAPELPATTLEQGCYKEMFYATSLQVAPDLPATKLKANCYSSMFEFCRELKEMPIIGATSGARYACSGMFRSCSGLTSVYIPNCSGAYCFYCMFSYCTGLTSVPSFSGFEASEFESMFSYCTGLTEVTFEDTAPSGYKTYRYLFEGCSNISRVTVQATIWEFQSGYGTMDGWLYGVAKQGTFVKPAGVEIPVGWDGIPEGWTVEEV